MWDGSEDWALVQHNHPLVKLQVHFATSQPSATELAAIRRLLPTDFAQLTPMELRTRIGAATPAILGTFSKEEGLDLSRKAQALGLSVTPIDVSVTGYTFVNRSENSAPIFEDDDLAQRIAQAMLAHGRPIVAVINSE
jgi:hypothetical protein